LKQDKDMEVERPQIELIEQRFEGERTLTELLLILLKGRSEQEI
jgi:hypothetical protein